MSNDKRMQKGERTSNYILHRTVEIVARHGLNGVTTAKVAEASGVSKSTIFHHFKTRDEVLKSALDLVFYELSNTMKVDNHHNVEEFLKSIGHFMFQLSDTTRTYVEAFLSYFHEGIFNPEYRHIFVHYVKEMEMVFQNQIRQLMPETVDEKNIRSISSLLLPMIDGLGLHYLLTEDREKYLELWNLQIKGIIYILHHQSK